MNKNLGRALAFLSGAIAGGTVVGLYMRSKMIDALMYAEKIRMQHYANISPANKSETVTEEPNKEEVKNESDMKNIISENGYGDVETHANENNTDSNVDDEYTTKPYEISGYEYGALDGYDIKTLYLYSDGEMRTDKGVLMTYDEIDNEIGIESATMESDFNSDGYKYIRNDRLRADYEIIYDEGRFSDE